MKERPILFSGPMVRAIIEGRKTQTRRIVKQVPHWQHCGKDIMEWGLSGCYTDDEGWHWLDIQTEVDDNSHDEIKCPYGQPGDRLWVRETWAPMPGGPVTPQNGVIYRADSSDSWTWRPSIHMPRWASRITLEITSVRVERLREISASDSIAEGIEPVPDNSPFRNTCGWKDYLEPDSLPFDHDKPSASFRTLWESINGPGSWKLNPWAWVIEFKKL
jgi:hypothetical protein